MDSTPSIVKSNSAHNLKTRIGASNRTNPFEVDDTGVYRCITRNTRDGDSYTERVWFMSPVRVLAQTRNCDGEDWGRLIKVVDRDGNKHLWPMPAMMLAGTGEHIKAELLRLGAEISPKREARMWLLEYLQSANPEQRATTVSRIGWHAGTFVFPDESIGPKKYDEQVILQSPEKLNHAFNIAGTTEDWKNSVACLAQGNSRLIFAISLAFAAPLLKIAGEDGGGIHLRGASSTGKSTALIVAGSVFGGGGQHGYVRQWRATDNALESITELSCDAILCLDELSQIDASMAGKASYLLANGKGKARANRKGQARQIREWRILFLSSGEIGLEDKIKEGGGRIAAGMQVRVVDLRADAGAGMGILEDLHTDSDPAGFASRLKKLAQTYYGAAGRAFISEITNDPEEYKKLIGRRRSEFLNESLPEGADGQVRRVADRFALAAAAGELATHMELTDWPIGAAKDAAAKCFRDWLSERGGTGPSEIAEAKRRVANAIQVHGSSRFEPFGDNLTRTPVIHNRLGFVEIEDGADEKETKRTYLFLLGPFKELLNGLDYRMIVNEFTKKGIFVTKNNNDANASRHIPGQGKHRVYEIDRDKLEIGSEGG